jgi:hypothetical protein
VLTVAATGDICDCLWEDGKRSGLGILFYGSSGNFFKGTFLDDKIDGFGSFYDAATRELYMGMFQNNQRHGDGYLITSVSNSNNASSRIKWQEQFYEGQFKNGKRDGAGEVVNAQPNLAKIMDKFGVDSDEWNSFESKFTLSKQIVKTLRLRTNNLTTSLIKQTT